MATIVRLASRSDESKDSVSVSGTDLPRGSPTMSPTMSPRRTSSPSPQAPHGRPVHEFAGGGGGGGSGGGGSDLAS